MIYYTFSFTILICVNLLRSGVTADSINPNVGDGNDIKCDEMNKPGWSILSLANVTLGAWPWSCLNSRYTETTLNKEVSNLSPDIFDATAKGYIGFVQYYFDRRGVDLYENFDDDGVNPMYLAIANGHSRIVKYFVANDFGISCDLISASTNRHYLTSPECAALYGQLEILKYLLKEITYSLTPYKGHSKFLKTLALAAAEGGQQNVLKYLVDEEGFIVNTNDVGLLSKAAKGGNVDMLKYLIYEKNINATNVLEIDIWGYDLYECWNLTLVCNAAGGGKLDAVIFFLETLNYTQYVEHNEKSRWSRPLVAAVKGGSLPVIKYMIEEKGADINIMSIDSLLHIAAESGHLAVVKYLVECKHMDVDTMSITDVTPLYDAIVWGRLDVVKYLVGERNASLNITPGSNALLEASGKRLVLRESSKNDLKIVKFLVDDMKMITRIDEVDQFNRTATVRAACYSEPDILKFLVDDRHANITIVFPKDKTLLHLVAEYMFLGRDYLPVFRYLIEKKGFKVSARTATNETVLDVARKSSGRHSHTQTLTYLEQELSKENKAVDTST